MSSATVLAAVAKKVAELRDAVGELVRSVARTHERMDMLSKEQGPQGAAGKDGSNGRDGKDGADGRAGKDGAPGRNGTNGRDGKDGAPGRDGKDGEPGPIGPMPKHQWDGTKLRFQQTPNRWGAWTDLRGPSGGLSVIGGGGSGDGQAWNPDDLGDAADDLPEQFIVRQNGTWVRATYDQMVSWLGGAQPTTARILTEAGDTLVTEAGDPLAQE